MTQLRISIDYSAASILFFKGLAVVHRPVLIDDLLAISTLSTGWRVPSLIHSCLSYFHQLLSISSHKMAGVLVRKLLMVCLEDWCFVTSIKWVDGGLLGWWIVIHVMEPSLPCWTYFLNLSWEKFSSISIFNPSPLILT